jgi:hypothetical protein
MNHEKKVKSMHLKSKAQRSRRLLVLGFIVMIGISIIGCGKGDENVINDPDEYYVKYEVNSSTIYSGRKLDVTLNTETNETKTFTIDQRILWEAIIGPVQKGFNATLKVINPAVTTNKSKLYTNIRVSKNGSPFALKESDGSDTPRDAVYVSYRIDY